MFTDFFYLLREQDIPVSVHEFMALQEALESGLAADSLVQFYYLSRSLLVKNETLFDRFDQCFAHFFKGLELGDRVVDQVIAEMKKVPPRQFTQEEKDAIQKLNLREVLENFRKQWEQGGFHAHVGGNQAIGTGGTSTQGAFASPPAGAPMPPGGGRHGSAVKIAEARQFRNYSADRQLDTRQIKVALSGLRALLPTGPEDVLNVDKTITATGDNAGELELVFDREMRNDLHVVLLMDTGGSMAPYHETMNRLFSAIKDRFKKVSYYYFHNSPYQEMWEDMERGKRIPTYKLLRESTHKHKLILVGDAAMAPSELMEVNGRIDYWSNNSISGIHWLLRLKKAFPAALWLNPDEEVYWRHTYTTRMIANVFPMMPLTVSGITKGMKMLLKNRTLPEDGAMEKELRDSVNQHMRDAREVLG